MIVRVLVENTAHGACQCEHGLSLLVETGGKKYLVDSGSSDLFAQNAEIMDVDLSEVHAGFLSHAHYDHSSGFPAFFAKNAAARIYLQERARQKYYFKLVGPLKKYIGIPKGMLEAYPDRFRYVNGAEDLGGGIHILPHSTANLAERGKRFRMCGEVAGKIEYDDFSHEQTVVFEEFDGLVCFNSCSHGGVENIIEEVKAAFPGKKIKAFCGGFHMMGPTGTESCSFRKEEVQAVARQLMASSEAVFYSGHCTGTLAFSWLQEIMGDRIQAFHSGKVFEL